MDTSSPMRSTRPLSRLIVDALDLPVDHAGPYLLAEVTSLILVKNVHHADTILRLAPAMVALSRLNPRYEYRIIMEADWRSYMQVANDAYREVLSAQNNGTVLPETSLEVTPFPRMYERMQYGISAADL